MAKEKVKHLSGVFACVFAHAGHITKEEAQEIRGEKELCTIENYVNAEDDFL